MKQIRFSQGLIFCSLLLCLIGISTIKLPAVWAQTDATIQGRITNVADEQVSNVAVYAYQQNEQGQWVSIKSDFSDFDGNYAITLLSAGTYRLKFEAPFNSNYFDKFHPNAESIETAADIPISAGQTITIDTVLQQGATIQGRITNAADEPIMGAAIYAYQQDEQGQWVSVENDYSDFDGNYAITPLSAGASRLKFEAPFNSNYFDKFHPNAETVETAADIPISAGQTLTIDTVLQQGATIQGKVINSAGAPIKGAYIYAYRLNTQGEWDSVASDFTNFDENYSITPLLAGTYRLQFDAPYNSDYLDNYHLNAEAIEAATDIPLTAGQVITVDTILQNSGHIAGKITNQAGAPIADASVTTYYQAIDGEWTYGGSHKSNATGDYNIGGLHSKAYRLEIDPPFSSKYLAEYYDNAATLETATNIAVSAGVTTPINVKLETGGTVAGRVTNKQGAPIADVLVYLYRRASEGDWSTIRSVRTNASGDYTIQGLTAGNCRVEFNPPFASVYMAKFYENATEIDSATDVAVNLGQTTTVNTTLVEGGRITGKVLNRAGTPIAGLEVTAYYDFVQCGAGYGVDYGNNATTDATGQYTISRLAAGLYRLQFDDPNKQYKTTYYPTANKLENATESHRCPGANPHEPQCYAG